MKIRAHTVARAGLRGPPFLGRLRSALGGSEVRRVFRAHSLSKGWHPPCGTFLCQGGVLSLQLRRFAGFVHQITATKHRMLVRRPFKSAEERNG